VKYFPALIVCYLFSVSIFYTDATAQGDGEEMEWRAGVAGVVITPEQPIWMAGYGARDRPAEGTLHDLWAKALALEDADGNQAVLVTTDLLGFPEEMSGHIRDQVQERYGLSRSQIILNSSHTHAGPVLENALIDIYPLDSEQQTLVGNYSRKLEDQIISLVGEALNELEPARLFAENGVARFAVNRRNNPAATLYRATELAGPTDYAVPVIKVEAASGEIMAVVFGYACHPTVLSDYDWSGDYPGFAQLELEKAYPGAKAMFFQGAGADQNPLPRRSVALAEQYGRTLAAAVQRVLDEEMRELPARLSSAYSEVELNIDSLPTREELEERVEESTGYMQRWAERMLYKLDRDEEFRTSYKYPVQIWKLGDQMVVSLGGELVVEYAIRIKEVFGNDTFVMGYSNDVMAYIPTTKIIREGGYEGDQSQMVYGLPGLWSTDVEILILSEILSLSESLR
jgi:neutral ceramidase